MQRISSEPDTRVMVVLPAGKITTSGQRVPAKKQHNMTCVLTAMRRFALFNENNPLDLARRKAYKKLKKTLAQYNGKNLHTLIQLAESLCDEFKINYFNKLANEPLFIFYTMKTLNCASPQHCAERIASFYLRLSEKLRWQFLYAILLEEIVMPLFHLEKTKWHPSQGFNALVESLKKYGAHSFQGKFGGFAYTEVPSLLASECTGSRKVFNYNEKSYVGNLSPYTHQIIVDAAKIIDGEPVLFYRDPNFNSTPGKKELIFSICYEAFTQRLTTMQGFPIRLLTAEMITSIGVIAQDHEELARALSQPMRVR